MSGGLVTSGSRWDGGRVWRAPSQQQRVVEHNERLALEAEKRRLKDLKHNVRLLGENRRLEQRVVRESNRALGAGLGLGGGLLGSNQLGGRLGGGDLLGGGGLYRSRSAGNLSGLAMGLERERHLLDRDRLLAAQSHKAVQIEQVRNQRRRIEEESARRVRTASMLRQERTELAALNNAVLASPGRHAPLGVMGGGGLGVGLGAGLGGLGRRRANSFSGLPVGGLGLGLGSPGMVRLPSPRASPRMMPVQPIVHNHNTYNISPRMNPVGLAGGSPGMGLRSHHGSPLMGGGLGMADDLYGGAIDPLVLGGNAMGMGGGGMFPSPHMGGSPRMGGMGHPFVCTDEQVPPPGRIIVRQLGIIEGYSGNGGGMMNDDAMVDAAVANLVANARSMGANAVVGLNVDDDMQGGLIARGNTMILN